MAPGQISIGVRLGVTLLAILPALGAAFVQASYWVNIPIWDEWDTPGTALLRAAQGTLTWQDLIAQHNEARLLFPRLLHIALSWGRSWDVRDGMLLTLVAAGGVSAFALKYLRQLTSLRWPHIILAWGLINFCLFAPSQYENFLYGFAYQMFVPVLCLFGCIMSNLSQMSLGRKVLVNTLLALVATYTFSHGMLVWVLAIPIVFRRPLTAGDRWKSFLYYSAYAVTGILAIAYYFQGYVRPPVSPPPATLTQFPQIVEFLIVWMGALMRIESPNPRVTGTIMAIITAATFLATILHLRRHRQDWPLFYPWLLLLTFSSASGLVTAVGRVNLGVDIVFNTWFFGFSSVRYNANSVILYVANIGLVSALVARALSPAVRTQPRLVVPLTTCCTVFALLWAHMLQEELARLPQFRANRVQAQTAAIWATTLPNNPQIFAAYPYPQRFSKRVAEMLRWSVLRLPTISPGLQQKIATPPLDPKPTAGSLDTVERQEDKLRAAGWARIPGRNVPADFVVLGWMTAGGEFRPFTALPVGRPRPDVAQALQSDRFTASGFDAVIETAGLPARAQHFRAWAIDFKRQEAFPLANAPEPSAKQP
ncbi:hypothetical protein BH20VER1_BH20VER1_19870 [soil metagenome]